MPGAGCTIPSGVAHGASHGTRPLVSWAEGTVPSTAHTVRPQSRASSDAKQARPDVSTFVDAWNPKATSNPGKALGTMKSCHGGAVAPRNRVSLSNTRIFRLGVIVAPALVPSARDSGCALIMTARSLTAILFQSDWVWVGLSWSNVRSLLENIQSRPSRVEGAAPREIARTRCERQDPRAQCCR